MKGFLLNFARCENNTDLYLKKYLLEMHAEMFIGKMEWYMQDMFLNTS